VSIWYINIPDLQAGFELQMISKNPDTYSDSVSLTSYVKKGVKFMEMMTMFDQLCDTDEAKLKKRISDITGAKRITEQMRADFKLILSGGEIDDDLLKKAYEDECDHERFLPKIHRKSTGEKLKNAARVVRGGKERSLSRSSDGITKSVKISGSQCHISEQMDEEEIFEGELTKILINASNRMQNGLFLFTPGTGIGKSFSAAEFFVDMWWKGRSLVFATALKSNLEDPKKDMLKAARRRFSDDVYAQFKESIIIFKPAEDAWATFLGKYNSDHRAAVMKIAKKTLNELGTLEWESFERVVHACDQYTWNKKHDVGDIIKDTFIREEQNFRRLIKHRISNIANEIMEAADEDITISKHDARAHAIQEFGLKNPWFYDLYPLSKIWQEHEGRKSVMLCSISKTAFPADDMLNPSGYLFSKIASMGGIVVIDEIDQSKAVYRNHLISDRPCDMKMLASILWDSFNENTFREILHSFRNEEKKKQLLDILAKAEDIRNGIRDDYGDIDPLIEWAPRCSAEMARRSNFIIGTSYRQFTNENLSIHKNERGTGIIDFYDDEFDTYKDRLDVYMARVETYVKFFFDVAPIFLGALAAKRGFENRFLPENVNSYLALCGFIKGTQLFNYAYSRISRMSGTKIVDIPYNSIYNRGISLTAPGQDQNASETSPIYSLVIDTSPEAILATMASTCLVIGMSATGDIETTIDNYNFDWLKDAGIRIERLTEENRQIIIEVQHRRFEKLDEVAFDCDSISGLQNPDIDLDYSILCVADEITGRGDLDDNWTRSEAQALRCMFGAFQTFCNNDHYAGFAFMHRFYGEKSDTPGSMEIETHLREIFDNIGANNDVTILFVDARNIYSKKEIAHEILASGGRVFIVTTFQSGSTGQNFQYGIPKGTEFIRVASDGYREDDDMIDFDFVYLSEPTNIFPVKDNEKVEAGQPFTKLQALQAFLVEELHSHAEISHRERQRLHSDIMSRKTISLARQKEIPSITGSVILRYIQAVGRTDRTVNKRNRVGYYFADSCVNRCNMQYIRMFAENSVLNPFAKRLMYCLADKCSESGINASLDREEKKLSLRAYYTGSVFNSSFGEISRDNLWDEEKILWRETEAAFSLKNPVAQASDFDCEEAKQFGIEYHYLPVKKAWYRYGYKEGVGDIEISLTPKDGFTHISSERTNLDTLMLCPQIKEFFEEKGYATKWPEEREYIMSPALMINLYMGMVGEAAFDALMHPLLNLQREKSLKIYELFDFFVSRVGIDVKNFTPEIYSDENVLLDMGVKNYSEKVEYKLNRTGYTAAVYVNMVDDGRHGVYHLDIAGRPVLVVCGIVDRAGIVNRERIIEIEKFIRKYS